MTRAIRALHAAPLPAELRAFAQGAAGWGGPHLAQWLAYELGAPAADIAPNCTIERLPLQERRTHKTLRVLWRDARLLLRGVRLAELAAQSAQAQHARACLLSTCRERSVGAWVPLLLVLWQAGHLLLDWMAGEARACLPP